MGDKWTLLIIRDLAAGPRRFVELQRVLPGISTEQLRSRLNRMVADGLLTRQRYREVPPRVDYELTERSRELMPVLGALARWGYDWTWSAPAPRRGRQHRRDLPPRAGHARAAARRSRAPSTWWWWPRATSPSAVPAVSPRTVRSRSPSATWTAAPTRRSWARRDWVRALGPEASLESLEVRGPRSLAEELLGGFLRAAAQQREAVHAA